MTKHTPGPWELDEACVLGPDRKTITECYTPARSDAESLANARLIVRAVNCHADLLAECEKILAWYGRLMTERGCPEFLDDFPVRSVAAAIAKARS